MDMTTQRRSDWHRREVGGLWEEIGWRQFEYMVERGLQPGHQLLDMGCGSLRGGVHFIRYLEPDHYVGIDKDAELLECGRTLEVSPQILAEKRPLLVQMDDFSFGALNRRFDYALAQSVFTHLPLNSIMRCLVGIDEVLVPGGQFCATFFENECGKRYLGPLPIPNMEAFTYCDRDPYHYTFDAFRWCCEGTGLTVERVGDWGHPRGQRMMVFHKR